MTSHHPPGNNLQVGAASSAYPGPDLAGTKPARRWLTWQNGFWFCFVGTGLAVVSSLVACCLLRVGRSLGLRGARGGPCAPSWLL